MNREELKVAKPIKLVEFLLDNHFSYNEVLKMLRKKDVRVNGVKVGGDVMLSAGDAVCVYFKEKKKFYDIIYDGETCAVVYKYPSIETEELAKLLNMIAVHRLDRNTSGLIMIAKNNKAHEFLADQIRTKSAKRKYLAIVHGNFENKTGTINAPISRNPSKPEKMGVVEGGKSAITHYKVIEQFNGFSFLELELETGRTHQIRVHMSHIGHPIVNDSLYNKIPFKVKTTEQLLQSYSLQFATLDKNDIINLEIKPDNDIEKVLKYLRSNQK